MAAGDSSRDATNMPRSEPSTQRPARFGGNTSTDRIRPPCLSTSAAGSCRLDPGWCFTGDNDGFFHAFDATTGKEFWRYQTGAPIWGSAPISYVLDGRQWVVTTSGLSLVAFALPAPSGPSR
ncbi:MAG: hypothetical protein DMF92_15980 [Acidobacteria bacterium]|nr:MAG: hypothetical protein DMF92_15980 [Acidobacteriota bacterium]